MSEQPTQPLTGPSAKAPESEALPIGLWIGTAVFIVLAAGALVFGIRFGRKQVVDSSNKRIEKSPIEAKERQGDAAQPSPALPEAIEKDRQEAVLHWKAGVIAYQKGDAKSARVEWENCARLDGANQDCSDGLAKLTPPAPMGKASR